MTTKAVIEFSARNPEQSAITEVDIRARAFMSQDRKLTYRDATRAVFTADPDLHRAYLDETPPLRPNSNGG